jgi:hypothetical protein
VTSDALFRIKLLSAFVLGAAAILTVTLAASRPDPRLAGLSFEERAFCSDQSLFGGADLVNEIGARWLGWQLEPIDDGGFAPPDSADLAHACRIANLLYGLSGSESAWCRHEANRERFLAPAVEALGMGEEAETALGIDEELGNVYIVACRFAYNHWREAGVSAIGDPRSHPFMRLSDAEATWCREPDHRVALEWAASELGIETPASAPQVHQIAAHVRACRLAFLLGGVPEGTFLAR